MQKFFLFKVKPVVVFDFVELLKNERIFDILFIEQTTTFHIKIFFRRIAILRNDKNSLKCSIVAGFRILIECFSDHVLQPRGHTPGKPRRGSPSIPRVTAYPGRAELRLYLKKISWCRKLQEK